MAGFSRAHLTRVFRESLAESPAELERRLRLERAAYLLLRNDISVLAASQEAGYATPEAFSRAFRSAYGLLPSDYSKQKDAEWRLPCPSDVHWEPNRQLNQYRLADTAGGDYVILDRPTTFVAAYRNVGDYTVLDPAWNRLAELVPTMPWEQPGVRLIALYHDDIECKEASVLRCDIGYTIDPTTAVPAGLKLLEIPRGVYVATREPTVFEPHGAQWERMTRDWLPRSGRRPINFPALDELQGWPVGNPNCLSRQLLGLDIDLGQP